MDSGKVRKFWQEHIKDLKKFPCELCNSLEFRKLYLPEKHGIDSQLVQCTNCGLLFLNPRWDIETYRKLYQDIYRTEIQKDNYETEFEKYLPSASRLLRIANSLNGGKKWRKVLDVGSGYGSLLWMAKNLYGAEVFGFEPDTELAKSCNSFFDANILPVSAEDGIAELTSKGVKFDLIVCQQSLNHFFHPVKILKSLGNLLNYDGFLCLEVLDFETYVRKKGPRIQVDHICYFTKETLITAFKAAGFMELSKEYDIKTKSNNYLPNSLPNRHIRTVACLRPVSFGCSHSLMNGKKEISSIDKLLKEIKPSLMSIIVSKIKKLKNRLFQLFL